MAIAVHSILISKSSMIINQHELSKLFESENLYLSASLYNIIYKISHNVQLSHLQKSFEQFNYQKISESLITKISY